MNMFECECGNYDAWIFDNYSQLYECQTCGESFNIDGQHLVSADAWGYQLSYHY